MYQALIIRCVSASIYRDTEFLLKIEPFVIVKVGNQKFKTAVAKSAGKNPQWLDVFECNVNDENTIDFEVWNDVASLKHHLIGSGNLKISQLIDGFNDSIPLVYQTKLAGVLQVSIEIQKHGELQKQPPKMKIEEAQFGQPHYLQPMGLQQQFFNPNCGKCHGTGSVEKENIIKNCKRCHGKIPQEKKHKKEGEEYSE